MRVGKFLGHLAVDQAYREALGKDVTFIQVAGDPWVPTEWRYVKIAPMKVSAVGETKLDVDVFVVDGPECWQRLQKAPGIHYTKVVWHCHGLYDLNDSHTDGMRQLIRSSMAAMPVMYEDETMGKVVSKWRGEKTDSVVVGRALTRENFGSTDERNGRAMLLGNRVVEAFRIRSRPEVSFEIWDKLLSKFPLLFDVYGFNNSVPVTFRRGYTPHITELRWYSVGCFPSTVTRCSFSMLETMAASVPCVMTTDKEGLSDEKDGDSWVKTDNAERFVDEAQRLMLDSQESLRMGKKAQEWVREKFWIAAWKERMLSFLSKI